MKRLVLIKLGGSVITDKSKPFTARPGVIRKLASMINKKYRRKDSDLVIGHGGGSFPHVPASKYQTQKGILGKDSIKGFYLTADAAIKINRIVISEFLKKNIPVASFSPLSFIYGTKIMTKQIKKALDIGIIPMIYGDVIMDEKQGFRIYSGEKILDLLARKLAGFYKNVRIIYYTDTNGVYDGEGKTITKITPQNFHKIKKFLTGSNKTDVTGGMVHKVYESLNLVKKIDAVVYIMNGSGRGKFTKISKN